MSLKSLFSVLAALVVVLAGVSVSQAQHCGVAACGSPCPDTCFPKVRYKTCYETVVEERCKQCWETVHKTIEKECRYTICKPVYEEKIQECKKIVCKPVWEEKQVKVCCGEWKTETVCVPGAIKCVKSRTPDTCCFDPCTCKTIRCPGQEICTYVQCPSRTECRKVWVPREEVRTVKVCRMVQEEVVEKVPVKICRMVQEEVVKKVPVTVCEKVLVQRTEKVCKKVPVKVAVCECEQPRCCHLTNHLGCLKDRLCGLLSHRCGHGCDAPVVVDCAPAAPAAPAGASQPMPKK